MNGRPIPARADPSERPIELHLPDGGYVIVSIEDPVARLSGDCDELILALVEAEGSERDVERAIRVEATELGWDCVASRTEHPTVISVRPMGR